MLIRKGRVPPPLRLRCFNEREISRNDPLPYSDWHILCSCGCRRCAEPRLTNRERGRNTKPSAGRGRIQHACEPIDPLWRTALQCQVHNPGRSGTSFDKGDGRSCFGSNLTTGVSQEFRPYLLA